MLVDRPLRFLFIAGVDGDHALSFLFERVAMLTQASTHVRLILLDLIYRERTDENLAKVKRDENLKRFQS